MRQPSVCGRVLVVTWLCLTHFWIVCLTHERIVLSVCESIREETSMAPLAIVVTVNQLLGRKFRKMPILDEVGTFDG